jgi:hypothetical protein
MQLREGRYPALEAWLFRMRHDINEVVGVAYDTEIKTPPTIDSGLPDVLGLVVLLGSQGWVAEIAEEMTELFSKLPLYPFRSLRK